MREIEIYLSYLPYYIQDMLNYFLASLSEYRIVFLVMIYLFYKSFYERLMYLNLYIIYLLFPIFIVLNQAIPFYAPRYIDTKHLELFVFISNFLTYNFIILTLWRFIVDIRASLLNIWKLIKLLLRAIVIIFKFFFTSKPIQPQVPLKAQYRQQKQVKSKPKQTTKKQTKPRQKRAKKPIASKRKLLDTIEVYSSIGQKLDLYADTNKKGGEAEIYDVTDDSLAKIFHKKIDLKYKEDIVEKLIKINFSDSVVKPIEALYDKNQNFIGYSMEKKEECIELEKIFLGKITDFFPKYTLIDKIDLAITIIEAYQDIHKESVIAGDINGSNVLVSNKDTIFIIDSDSFQIGKPSPAYKDQYRRTRHLSKHILDYMRTRKDDNFAITMLVFQLIHQGRYAYGGTDEESLVNAEYIFNPYYPNKNIETNKVLIRIHNNLSLELKKAFRDVFKYDRSIVISTLKEHLLAYKQILLEVQNKQGGKK